jgi:hypothetical protein
MALTDLFWACPSCGADRALRGEGRGVRCQACQVGFERAPEARIRATSPDGKGVVRSVPEWLDRLPSPASLVEAGREGGAVRTARVTVRAVEEDRPVHGEDGFLNRVELFGDARPGTLELHADSITFRPDDGPPLTTPLEELTAVQASSRTLQLKRRGSALESFRFLDDAVYLWELLLHAALRDRFGRLGRGEIVEFQPRITTR